MAQLTDLPANLPVPIDDGACDHLEGMNLPDLSLPSTEGETIKLSALTGTTVIYIYPMTGRPGIPLPDGWDQIPGARGCTPQSCAFRDHHKDLTRLNATVFGLSTQSTSCQQEAVERLHLPYALLSDESLELVKALSLPTIEVENNILIKRITLICNDSVISKIFYPVFPPDQNAIDVVNYLKSNDPNSSN